MGGVVVLGGINLDIVCTVQNLPRAGETVASLGLDHSPGGKGLNQAVAAGRLGASVHMLGAVGQDAAGNDLAVIMADSGVATDQVIRVADGETGRAFITLSSAGDNMIVVHAGANMAYGAAELAGADLHGATVFLTQFEATLPAVRALFSTAEALAGTRILNTAPALEAGRDLLPLADILVMNETELQRFAGWEDVPSDPDAIEAAARSLLRDDDQAIIVTLGGDGCVLVTAAGVETFPAIRAAVVDTIGAGDCFCGALAARLAVGEPIGAAIRYATAAAALSVGRRGAASSMPTADEVEALLASATA